MNSKIKSRKPAVTTLFLLTVLLTTNFLASPVFAKITIWKNRFGNLNEQQSKQSFVNVLSRLNSEGIGGFFAENLWSYNFSGNVRVGNGFYAFPVRLQPKKYLLVVAGDSNTDLDIQIVNEDASQVLVSDQSNKKTGMVTIDVSQPMNAYVVITALCDSQSNSNCGVQGYFLDRDGLTFNN